MRRSKSEPALSDAEWVFVDNGLPAAGELDQVEDQVWVEYSVAGKKRKTNRRHALAALCLRGQSFGFSSKDVGALRRELEYNHGIREVETLQSLVDRIGALLPPEEAE